MEEEQRGERKNGRKRVRGGMAGRKDGKTARESGKV
jgi:hypothetical protein